MAGFRVGASEASPFIAQLIHVTSPVWGLAASKLISLGIGAYCVGSKKIRLMGWINYWYAALIVWNLCVIAIIGPRLAH